MSFPDTKSLTSYEGYTSFELYKNIFPCPSYCKTANNYGKSFGFSYDKATGILSWTGSLGSGYDNVNVSVYLII